MAPSKDGIGYTGHVNDADTNLVYMQARYYDPSLGRFLSVDFVAPEAGDYFGFGRYGYGRNNPILNIDPDGRQSESVSMTEVYLRDGSTISVPTRIAGQVKAADEVHANLTDVNNPNIDRKGAAKALDKVGTGATVVTLSTSELPPVAAVAAVVDEVTTVGAFAFDPTAERLVSVATLGLNKVAKAGTKGSETAAKILENQERIKGVGELADKAAEAQNEHANKEGEGKSSGTPAKPQQSIINWWGPQSPGGSDRRDDPTNL